MAKCKKFVRKIVDSWHFSLIMTGFTIYALFFDDLRLSLLNKNVDDGFYAFTSFALFMFTIEIIFTSLVVDNYFRSFFFWVDMVATLSLLADIGWITDQFIRYAF